MDITTSQAASLIAKQTSVPQLSTQTFSDEERSVVSWFFAMMRTQWGAAKFCSQFGEGEDVRFAKRHWADRILKHSPEQLQAMLRQADDQRISGNEKFSWPDPAQILSLRECAWERQCHRVYQRENLLEDKSSKEWRKAKGAKNLREMRARLGI